MGQKGSIGQLDIKGFEREGAFPVEEYMGKKSALKAERFCFRHEGNMKKAVFTRAAGQPGGLIVDADYHLVFRESSQEPNKKRLGLGKNLGRN